MKSKTILGADGATKMRQITVGIHGKGGEAGIKAIQQLAGMVDSLKQCQTPQEVYDRYLQITGYCKCCVDCNFIDQKGADELMCLAAYLAGNEQARAEAQQKAGKKGMRKVYICSPYRAKDGAELDRNIDYAQQLTRQALEAGLAPITPHLYMTQCMDDKKPEERARGMAAGLALLKGCDFVIAGVKYGITEGMDREIHTANMLGITVIDANQIKRHLEYEEKRQERAASDYAKLHSCEFCSGSKLYSCTGYDCREPYRRAYEYALSRIRERQET